jgi:WD40 repeat protein
MPIKASDLTAEQKYVLLRQLRAQMGDSSYRELAGQVDEDAIIEALLARHSPSAPSPSPSAQAHAPTAATKINRKWPLYASLVIALLAGIAFPDGEGLQAFVVLIAEVWWPACWVVLAILGCYVLFCWLASLFSRGGDPPSGLDSNVVSFLAGLITALIALIGGFVVNLDAQGIRVFGMAFVVFVLSYPVLFTLGLPLARLLNGKAHWAVKMSLTVLAVTLIGGLLYGVWDLGVWCFRARGPFAQVARLVGHAGPVRMAAFADEGHRVLSFGVDNSIRIWDVASSREVRQLANTNASLLAVSLSPDLGFVVGNERGRHISLWDVGGGQLKSELHLKIKADGPLALGPGGKHLLVGEAGSLVLRDSATGDELRRFGDALPAVRAVVVSRDGQLAVSVDATNVIRVWNIQGGREQCHFAGQSTTMDALAISPDNSMVLAGASDGALSLWSVKDTSLISSWPGHTDRICHVAFSPDGGRCLSASKDGTVRLWTVQGAVELGKFVGHKGAVQWADVSPDGRTALSCGGDGTIRLWRLP